MAMRALNANALRTILSVTGIVIGVGCVVALMAIGEGQKRETMAIFERLGSNRVNVMASWGRRGGANIPNFRPIAFDWRDYQTLLSESRTIKEISPTNDTSGQVKYLNNVINARITGVIPAYFSAENFTLFEGRLITDEDVATAARVAVLGSKTSEDLFGTRSPVGEVIKINGKQFVVVGLLEEKGQFAWYNPDEQLVVPLTTLQKRLTGNKEIDEFVLKTWNLDDTTEAEREATEILSRLHNVPFGQEEDYIRVFNTGEMQKERERSAHVIKVFLSVVSGLTLFIGGVGIMNIMLVTVTERTREIGIRKALGATRANIIGQFLTETLLICLGGAIVGIGLGVLAAKGLGKLPEDVQFPVPIMQTEFIFLAAGVSVAVALVFGIFPAMRAASLDPIDALKYE
jgi:ABC-type antimicrobial peptide transport system permease subunit